MSETAAEFIERCARHVAAERRYERERVERWEQHEEIGRALTALGVRIEARIRRIIALAIPFALLALPWLSTGALAQAVPCVGPVQGACVPVIIGQSSAGTAGFPANAVPITASGTGSTGAISASLAAAAGKFTYVCGLAFQGSDATAAIAGNIAVTGTVTGTMNFGYVSLAAGAAVPQPPPTIVQFNPCVPSSAVNTAITVTPPTLGTGAPIATVSSWGFQL